MNDQQVDLKVRVTVLNASYKQGGLIGTLDWSADPSKTIPPEERQPEIDPDHVLMSFALSESNRLEDSGSVLMSTLDAKKLGLMIGDKLTLRIVKEADK